MIIFEYVDHGSCGTIENIIIAIGEHQNWCVLQTPERTEQNDGLLECLQEDEENQFYDIEESPGVYLATYQYTFTPPDNGEGGLINLRLLWNAKEFDKKDAA